MSSSSIINAKDLTKSPKSEKEEIDIKSHKDIEGFSQWIEEDDARYLAMKDVYEYKTKSGDLILNGKWEIVEVINDTDTGFRGKLYNEVGTSNYVFAAAGTEDWWNLLAEDWRANKEQQHGKDKPQYDQAQSIAKYLSKKYRNCNLIFVGHSLGGGLASTMSRITGLDAITFNSSALKNPKYKGVENSSKIAAYITDGDILDYVNEFLFHQKVEGQIIRRISPTSKIPNLHGIPRTGIYQAARGIFIHCDPNVL